VLLIGFDSRRHDLFIRQIGARTSGRKTTVPISYLKAILARVLTLESRRRRARTKVTVEKPFRGDIYVVVSTGGSFSSSSLQQELGLGAAKTIRALEVSMAHTLHTR
jgi:hypothetical protein